MRVALLPDDYLPDSTRVHAKMFHELALEFLKRGHEPIVITPGDPNQKTALVIDDLDGVEVWRFRTGRTRGVGKVRRALNESLLSFNSWKAIQPLVENKPFDLCVNYSPTIFFGPLARKLRRRGAYVYLILRDMFPQWIIDEGFIKEGSLIARYFRFFERLNYRQSDCIGVMSEANLKLFNRLQPSYANVQVLMNWADTQPFTEKMAKENWLEKLKLQDKIVFFYGGNIGHAQDMANLMRLAKGMLHRPKAHFLFVGQGDEVELIHRLKQEWSLDNVTIKSSVSQQVYCELLAQVDVGLFSLSAKHTAHNFPGKLLGYMAAALPILGSVNRDNDIIELINNNHSGFVFENGADQVLLSAASDLLANASLRKSFGENARRLLERYFSVETAVDSILAEVEQTSRAEK